MLFSDCIPESIKGYPNVSSFMDIMDGLQNFKTEIISESFRVDNAGVLMDKKWIIKKLDEFGVSDIPIDYPIQAMRQYLLNADTVCRTRGSKIGIELYCSILSLGEVTVDDGEFYQDPKVLLLDSPISGFITADSSENKYYLLNDSSILEAPTMLSITVKSAFFNGKYPTEANLIKNYLKNTIKRNIGFSNSTVTFNWQTRSEFYFHKLLNPYFV